MKNLKTQIETISKKNCEQVRIQVGKKLNNSNVNKTQKLKLWQNFLKNIDNAQKLKLWQIPQTQVAKAQKLKNLNCDKTQKHKLWQLKMGQLKTQIVIKLKTHNVPRFKT